MRILMSAAAIILSVCSAAAQWTQYPFHPRQQVTIGMLALAATRSTIVAATTDGVVAASLNDLVFKRATPFVGDLAALLVSQDTVWLVTPKGEVLQSIDKGLSFQSQSSIVTESGITCGILHPSGTLYLADANRVYRSIDQGRSWQSDTLAYRNGKLANYGPDICCMQEGFSVSTDEGRTWNERSKSGLTGSPNSIAIKDSLVVTAYSTLIFVSRDAGTTWTRYDPANSFNRSYSTVSIIDTTIYLCSSTGLFVSVDKGATWDQYGSHVDSIFVTNVVPTQRGLMCIGTSGVYHQPEQGAPWELLEIPAHAFRITSDVTASGSDVITMSSPGVKVRADLTIGGVSAETLDSTFSRKSLRADGSVVVAWPYQPRSNAGSEFYFSTDYGRTFEKHYLPAGTISPISQAFASQYRAILISGNQVVLYDNTTRTISNYERDNIPFSAIYTANENSIIYAFADVLAGDVKVQSIDRTSGRVTLLSQLPIDHPIYQLSCEGPIWYARTKHSVIASTDQGYTWSTVLTSNSLADLRRSPDGNFTFVAASSTGKLMLIRNGRLVAETIDSLTDDNTITAIAVGKYNDISTVFAGTVGRGLWTRPLTDFVSSASDDSDATTSMIKIQCSPQPATDILNIIIDAPGFKTVHVSIQNVLGMVMWSSNQSKHGDSTNFTVPTSHLASGFYCCTIVAGEAVVSQPILLSK